MSGKHAERKGQEEEECEEAHFLGWMSELQEVAAEGV